MFFMFVYFVSVIVSFKLGAHLAVHPDAPLKWIEQGAKWFKK
jgi:hypothetical protein